MLLQVICTLGIGLMIVIAFVGISVVIIGGKSDEELGYKVPMADLVSDPDSAISTPSIHSGTLYEHGKPD